MRGSAVETQMARRSREGCESFFCGRSTHDQITQRGATIAGKGDLTRPQGTSFAAFEARCWLVRAFAVLKSSQGRSTNNLHMTHIISRMQTRTQASPANAHPSFTSSIWHQDQTAERGLQLLRLSGMLWPVISKLRGQQTVCTCGHTEGHDHHHTA